MQISDAESVVMEVLWQRSPRAAEDVVAALAPRQDWQEATVKTLLNRLLKKGAIRAEKDGRRFLYSPAIERDSYVGSESRRFVDRLFGGRLSPLVARLAEEDVLDDDDIAAIEAILKELKS